MSRMLKSRAAIGSTSIILGRLLTGLGWLHCARPRAGAMVVQADAHTAAGASPSPSPTRRALKVPTMKLDEPGVGMKGIRPILR